MERHITIFFRHPFINEAFVTSFGTPLFGSVISKKCHFYSNSSRYLERKNEKLCSNNRTYFIYLKKYKKCIIIKSQHTTYLFLFFYLLNFHHIQWFFGMNEKSETYKEIFSLSVLAVVVAIGNFFTTIKKMKKIMFKWKTLKIFKTWIWCTQYIALR